MYSMIPVTEDPSIHAGIHLVYPNLWQMDYNVSVSWWMGSHILSLSLHQILFIRKYTTIAKALATWMSTSCHINHQLCNGASASIKRKFAQYFFLSRKFCLQSPFVDKGNIDQRSYIYIYILENNLLLFWRANHPIIVKVWLKFGALVGYPLCAIVVLHFLMQFFIRKHVLFVDGNFPEIGNFIFVYFKFHRVSFIFPLMAFMFPQTQTSSYFLFPSFILFKIHNINAFGKLY